MSFLTCIFQTRLFLMKNRPKLTGNIEFHDATVPFLASYDLKFPLINHIKCQIASVIHFLFISITNNNQNYTFCKHSQNAGPG